ncbi:MAG TPA: alpha-1,4-glucan--maltose-1-phosphate maltosyltransferase [Vicinamibacterales bacterium]|jgi:starch synthase (maltosyl-transferring)|nr:alpha-1,4-glucan--maltose-1-phosphate maltosyltransferase [Vicinamibacterales bacterium]
MPGRRGSSVDIEHARVTWSAPGDPGIPANLSRRVVIDRISPEVNAGRFPIKRTVGERVVVTADAFADGHDVVIVVLRDRPSPTSSSPAMMPPGGPPGPPGLAGPPAPWRETAMTPVTGGPDEWTAAFEVRENGWHEYQVAAWVDRFSTWRRDVRLKAAAGQDVSLELLEGSLILRDAADRMTARPEEAHWLIRRADALSDPSQTPGVSFPWARVALALDYRLNAVMAVAGSIADRSRATESAIHRVWVDRERARFGAWYEMFPRSAGPDPRRSATFREAAAALPRIADLGFDIVYLPPIHPIGTSFRKGPNNSLTAKPGDPGSPWAIGSKAGGHTAVEPGLGAITDFDAFRAEAERLGLEVALDLAWQCSPDHPWVREHPEWFRHRPDGSIRYAENPPKRYQDIYPFDFENEDWAGLWRALLDVTRFWISHGVRAFRADNPHTKTFGFWEWLIGEVHATDPDVLFLSEAFTRPKAMRYLAKAGFTQSYTYFTWRNSRAELTEYFTELTEPTGRTGSGVAEYLRPNLFANTPDILTAYLQGGGRPAFEARLLLAATLGASYGIYSGFELCERRAVAAGSEEYADSEKYQFRPRDWNAPGGISELVCRVNQIRRRHPALQIDRTLRFHGTDNEQIIAYSKTAADGSERILTIVNLDPHYMQHGFVDTPVDADGFVVRDLLDDTEYRWHRGWNYVRFDPEIRQGHVLWLPTPRT